MLHKNCVNILIIKKLLNLQIINLFHFMMIVFAFFFSAFSPHLYVFFIHSFIYFNESSLSQAVS